MINKLPRPELPVSIDGFNALVRVWHNLKTKILGSKERFSVAMRLNVLNVLVLISGLLSIAGAYEIQLGAQMHELNYKHQKYIAGLRTAITSFEQNNTDLESVRQQIHLIRKQPISCLELVGSAERLILNLLGTSELINICTKDVKVADGLLDQIDQHERQFFDSASLIVDLRNALEQFTLYGTQFTPLVEKTVSALFLIVISVVVIKAFFVSFFGLFLSSSVTKDYTILSKTKRNLQEEKRRTALIQNEKMTSLSTLVAGVAHEINTPLGVTVTGASYAREQFDSVAQAYKEGTLTEQGFEAFFETARETFGIIEDNLGRTSALVKSFKQVSVDQSTEDMRFIDIESYINDVLASLTPLTRRSSVQIKIEGPEDLCVETYPGALSQVITNLITNSLTHAYESQNTGTILIAVDQLADDKIRLVFADDGCGISEKDLAHIFDPFFTTKRGKGGTGLGLHILHNLVTEKLMGTVKCTSKVGEGTRFEIDIPCATRSTSQQFI